MPDTAGLTTFVGRVRGKLTPDDTEWVESTSAAIEVVRADLIAASQRLGSLERRLASAAWTGPGPDPGRPAGTDAGNVGSGATDGSASSDTQPPTWEQVVGWAAAVNAALVELAARRRLPASFDAVTTGAIAAEQAAQLVSERSVGLGRLLQDVRGEQIVDELLSAGVLIGPPGMTGALAFQDHGAWDIEFLGAGGATIARADVKISNDPSEILDHLATRPGVDLVYTTSDAAGGLVGAPGVTVVRPGDPWPVATNTAVVIDVGSDSADMHAELVDALDSVGAEGSADALFEAVPFLALLVVGTRAAARAATSEDPGSDIATATWQQAKDVVTTAGVSELVGWVSGISLLKVPTTLTFALSRSAVRDARGSVELSGRRVARARRLMSGVATD